mgnify:CR=1 FL=1
MIGLIYFCCIDTVGPFHILDLLARAGGGFSLSAVSDTTRKESNKYLYKVYCTRM